MSNNFEVSTIMTKKGQGLPLNTIIIAIIVLVVLVVLIAIFTGKIAIFSSDLDKVANLEGVKVRAQLIGQNCVPSDAGVTSLLTQVDTLPKNNKLDDSERLAFSAQMEILKGRCTAKNAVGSDACRLEVGCQWQGS